MDIKITKTANPKPIPTDESKLGFGQVFTDHMFICNYNKEKGWHDARIEPFHNWEMNPAAAVYHYGMCIFEGLKAYRRADGKINLFRPDQNAARMANSARRMALPPFPEEDFVEACKTLVALDADWVPRCPGNTLYVRPTLICDTPDLSMHDTSSAIFFIILSPSGSYYKDGIKPCKILIEEHYARAVKGGTGSAKCGGNYAGAFVATIDAEARGYNQVLWLDGATKKNIEEVGSNNIMFVIDGKVVTPALGDTVLPGITRKSCIHLLKEWGYEVEERIVPVAEFVEACEQGRVSEVFGVGTAAVVTPVGVLGYGGKDYEFNGGVIGPVTQKLYDAITGTQSGKVEDIYNWVVTL